MTMCCNCFKNNPTEYIFCPSCGYPVGSVGLKTCKQGHVLFETFKSCIFCEQAHNVGHSLVVDAEPETARTTEVIKVVGDKPQHTGFLESGAGLLPDLGNRNQRHMEQPTKRDEGGTNIETPVVDQTRLETGALPGPEPVASFPEDTRQEVVSPSPVRLFPREKLHREGQEPLKTRLDIDGGDGKTRLYEDGGKTPPFFAWLVLMGETGSPCRDIRLDREKITIGKGDDADIRITDDYASRLHALIYFEKKRFFISDLGSTNGTFLDEARVLKEALSDGSRIRIGRQEMVFKQVNKIPPC